MSKILVSGSLAYDHIMDFPGLFKDHFLPEKLHNINVSFNIDTHRENFGGTAGNVAYTLDLLGEDVAIVATAGNDFTRYREYLEGLGIETDGIHIDEKDTTATAYIMTDQSDNQIAGFYPGSSKIPYGSDMPLEKNAVALISAGCIDDIRALPDIFRGNGVRFLFDPGQSILNMTANDLRNGITDAHTVFANDYEFAMITNKTEWKEEDVLKIASVLVITLGEEGSRVITKDGETRIKAVPVVGMKDPTGAGDAYRAGYIKALTMGKTPAECAQLGSAVAVYAVEEYGTQNHHFTLLDLQERYLAAYGEAIELEKTVP